MDASVILLELLIVILEKQMAERMRRPLNIAPQTPSLIPLSNLLLKGSVYFRRIEDIPEYVDVPTR